MKILTRNSQQEAFKELVEIIKVLATVDTVEATDAIVCAFDLAERIGVQRDLNRVVSSVNAEKDYKRWTDKFVFSVGAERRNDNTRYVRATT